MPVTRSMKSAPRQAGPPSREEESTSRPAASASGTPSGSEPTASSATTTESRTATTAPDTSATSTDATRALKSPVPEKPERTPARSRASSRRRELAEARLELARARVELAEAKVSVLEEETSDEEDSIDETVREERTSEWVDRSTLALTMEPHNVPEHSSEPPPAVPPPPPPRDDEPAGCRVDAEARGPIHSHPTKTSEERPYCLGLPGGNRQLVVLQEPPPRQEKLIIEDRRAALAQGPWNHTTGEPRQPVAPHHSPTLQEIRKTIENRRWETAQRPPGGDVAGDPHLDAPRQPPTRQDSKPNELAIQELASAITLAARSAAQPAIASRVPDLPFFSGQSAEWLPFKIAVEEATTQLTEQETIARLRKSLRGPARDAAHCLFVGHTSTREVMQLLEARFGRPDALVMAEMKKLRELPRLTENPKDVCVFASRVANITATIKALGRSHYLYNPEIVRAVIEKFPPTLRFRYYDFAPEQPTFQPDLVTLTKFLDLAAERCGNFAPLEHVPFDRREQTHRGPARTYHAGADGQRAKPEPCPVCKKGEHKVNNCEVFKKESVSARWDIAKEKRLCFKCLRVRRNQHMCKARRCETSGCQHSHHPLLHSTPQSKPPPEQEEIVSSARNKTKTALLKIVPVIVSGPRSQVETYALLDDGSTCTIVERDIANKVGATGTASPFTIEGVAGARIDASESTRVRVKIGGKYSIEEFEITARTMDKLHLSPQRVPPELISGLDHLKDIAKEVTYEGKPTVLIGQDNWQLLLTHAVRRGADDQPVASLTDLGWVLHGVRHRPREKIVHRISYLSAPRLDSIDEIEEVSTDPLCDEPRRSYDDREKRALSNLDETTHSPAGGGNESIETELQRRRDDFTPHNSDSSDLRRLEHRDVNDTTKEQPAGGIETERRERRDDFTPPDSDLHRFEHIVKDVATDATRDTSGNNESTHRRFIGPPLLHLTESEWPLQSEDSEPGDVDHSNERLHVPRPTWRLTGALPDVTRFSSYTRLLRATAPPRCTAANRRTKKQIDSDSTCKKIENRRIVVRSRYTDGYCSEEDTLRASRQVAFIVCRGKLLWSDQGTNLRGADIELRRAIDGATQEEASLRAIRWRFIPPSAPFMGGAWERMVRSIKTALYTTLNERAPKEEVLATLLVEAEHTVNSRPLTHLSTAPDDEEALTPNHFLLGGPSRVPQPGTFTDGDISGRREWRVSQRLADHFWARWVREYLPELQHRREPRATGGAIQLGDLVLIADGTLPRNIWPRGVVIATFPGPDGEVRAVDVRTNKGVLRRPTKKLVILPTANESP